MFGANEIQLVQISADACAAAGEDIDRFSQQLASDYAARSIEGTTLNADTVGVDRKLLRNARDARLGVRRNPATAISTLKKRPASAISVPAVSADTREQIESDGIGENTEGELAENDQEEESPKSDEVETDGENKEKPPTTPPRNPSKRRSILRTASLAPSDDHLPDDSFNFAVLEALNQV